VSGNTLTNTQILNYYFASMLYSDCMAIYLHGDVGVLVYIGHTGDLHEIVGGNDGEINLRKLG
jgi:hypothetical protein